MTERGSIDRTKYFVKIHSNFQNIGDAIDAGDYIATDYIYKWTPLRPIFVSAQTGSGKNTFIRKTINQLMTEEIFERKYSFLILSNRIALRRQEKLEMVDFILGILNSLTRTDKKINKEKKDYYLQYINDVRRNKNRLQQDAALLDEVDTFGNVTIKSYQGIWNKKDELWNNEDKSKNKYFDFVILDECHFFLADAKFNRRTYDILNTILKNCVASFRIYLSATLDEVFPSIIEAEDNNIRKIINKEKELAEELATDQRNSFIFKRPKEVIDVYMTWDFVKYFHPIIMREGCNGRSLYNVNIEDYEFPRSYALNIITQERYHNFRETFKSLDIQERNVDAVFEPYNQYPAIIYEFERDYNYIDCKYLKLTGNEEIDKNSGQHKPLINEIKKQIEDKNKEKWIIFVPSKKLGKSLLKDIGKDNAEYIDAKSKNKLSEASSYNNIIKNKKFEKKVLITTAVLDNGINIIDDKVKHIAILVFDRVLFLQMLGRKRIDREANERIKLYIREATERVTLYIQEYGANTINYLLQDTINKLERIETLESTAIDGTQRTLKEIFSNDDIFYYHGNVDIEIFYNKFLRNKLESDKEFLLEFFNQNSSFVGENTIIEQLSWIGQKDNFNIDNYLPNVLDAQEDVSVVDKTEKDELIEFLELNVKDIPANAILTDFYRHEGMNPKEQAAFCEKFTQLYKKAYPKYKSNAVYYKVPERLITANLPYDIGICKINNPTEKEKEEFKKEKNITYWILIRRNIDTVNTLSNS